MVQDSRRSQLESILERSFKPSFFSVEDESHRHGGGRIESHFKVVVVSDVFDGMSLLKRHQAVYAAVQVVMNKGIHALGLHCFTVGEWQQRTGHVAGSPSCRGGEKQQE